MPASKLGSYIVNYRSRRREAAEEERQRRMAGARPTEIVDPSFELFGYQSPPTNSFVHEHQPTAAHTPSTTSPDDWLYQNRRASTMPAPYQHDHYCQVTPQTSVSSTGSSRDSPTHNSAIDMGWESSRNRPQSDLSQIPYQIPSPAYSTLKDPNVGNHRVSVHIASLQRQYSVQDEIDISSPIATTFSATLSRPFSSTEPFEDIAEDVNDSQQRKAIAEPTSRAAGSHSQSSR